MRKYESKLEEIDMERASYLLCTSDLLEEMLDNSFEDQVLK